VLDEPVELGIAGAVVVLGLAAAATAAGLSLRDHVAPIGVGLSLVLALALYVSKERSERRRKTLEAYEIQILDSDLRDAVYLLRYAISQGTYAPVATPTLPSDVAATTLLLNYLETCCAGAQRGLYDRELMREFQRPLASFMIESFLVMPQAGRLATEAFLAPGPAATPYSNLRQVFPEVFAAAAQRVSDYVPAPVGGHADD
jgi:hypothetical protein